jgi:hexosaminidase
MKDGVFKRTGLPGISGDKIFQSEIDVFTKQIQETFGDQIGTTGNGILCLKNGDIKGREAYKMVISHRGVEIQASDPAGMFHGLQTLRQLILTGYTEKELVLPCGEIEDAPRFEWRGFMLDSSRHFYSVKTVRKFIDVLSLHHISVFHWHLTDDQGWRFPVPGYPELINIGSKRVDIRSNWGRVFEGHYTEEDIKEIVAYAAARHIEVVPEVDIPGHASAILASYPELGCTGGPHKVRDTFGIYEDVLCAGNPIIYDFAAAVFDTLARLFPSSYVHIGGDEVKTAYWEQCPKCRKLMEESGFERAAQLQGQATVRFAQMLKERGKTAIGWDEVLENTDISSLPPELIVMSWRGREGGQTAVAKGHRVIMSPLTDGCYFDYRPCDCYEEPGQFSVTTISQAYHLDPVAEMTDAQAALVIGGQANLWSELIYADRLAEYMIFPRICATAEAVWTKEEAKDFESFSKRLPIHQKRLDKLDLIQYRGPIA